MLLFISIILFYKEIFYTHYLKFQMIASGKLPVNKPTFSAIVYFFYVVLNIFNDSTI